MPFAGPLLEKAGADANSRKSPARQWVGGNLQIWALRDEDDMLYSNNGGTTWQWQVALTHLRFPRSDFHLPGVSEVLNMKFRRNPQTKYVKASTSLTLTVDVSTRAQSVGRHGI
jgi:hypothetical protein